MQSFMVVASSGPDPDTSGMLGTVASLPTAAWWDVDTFPLDAPVAAGAAS